MPAQTQNPDPLTFNFLHMSHRYMLTSMSGMPGRTRGQALVKYREIINKFPSKGDTKSPGELEFERRMTAAISLKVRQSVRYAEESFCQS